MPKEKDNLQNAFSELEKIVDELNTKDIDVEVALKKFKDGVELIEFCRTELRQAENEFKKLKSRLDTDSDADGEEDHE